MSTILSSRDYRLDAMYDICIWEKQEFVSLFDIKNSLENPKFTLYLGRKSCVLATPLFPFIIHENNLFKAFDEFEKDLIDKFQKNDVFYFFGSNFHNGNLEYFWEDEFGEQHEQVRVRRDNILSRKKWQFQERKEFYKSEDS